MTGYIPESGPNVAQEKIGMRHFVHENSYSINSTPYRCTYKKMNL